MFLDRLVISTHRAQSSISQTETDSFFFFFETETGAWRLKVIWLSVAETSDIVI